MRKSTKGVLGILGVVLALVVLAPLLSSLAPSPNQGAGDGSDGVTTDVAATSAPTAEAEATTASTAAVTSADGGSGAAQTATAGPTPTATAGPTPAATETVTASPTPTATPEPSLADRVNTTEISDSLLTEINDRRSSEGLQSLTDDGTTVATVTEMALSHTRNISERGFTSHEYDDNNSADRYKQWDLYQTCKFQSDGGGYIVTADQDQLEVLAQYDASQYDDPSLSSGEIADRIAGDVVDNWWDRYYPEQRLTYRNADRIGLGVVVTDDDAVFVTGNLC